MKTLYIDCNMGAAGDMLTAALLELLPNQDEVIAELNALSIPGVEVSKEISVKCGITGTHVTVKVNGEEEDEHMHDHEHHHHHDEEHSHDHEHHHDEHIHDHEHHHHDEEHSHDHNHHHHHDEEHSHNHEHHHDEEHSHDHEHHHDDEHIHDHEHHHAHHHSSMHDVEHIVSHLNVSEKVKKDVIAVYNLIADAESKAHGKPVSEIHFHEVGTMDAIADVTAVCVLMEKLGADKIVVSPIHVGSGQVRCAHGILPVPAPATVHILRNCPIYGGNIKGELCTPTGAALLKHFATEFGSMPIMSIEKIGYGMGKKDFEAANCVRILLGTEDFDNGSLITDSDYSTGGEIAEHVITLSCNIDDMTAEDIGYAVDEIFEAGAREVFTSPVYMKKSRPGTLLTVICDESKREEILESVFKNTTTIGVREFTTQRYVLKREIKTIETKFGEVREKISKGYGVVRRKLEHDDLARIAKEQNLSIDEVRKAISSEK